MQIHAADMLCYMSMAQTTTERFPRLHATARCIQQRGIFCCFGFFLYKFHMTLLAKRKPLFNHIQNVHPTKKNMYIFRPKKESTATMRTRVYSYTMYDVVDSTFTLLQLSHHTYQIQFNKTADENVSSRNMYTIFIRCHRNVQHSQSHTEKKCYT